MNTTITLRPNQQKALDWLRANTRHPVIVLAGPPAVGKTTVIEEFMRITNHPVMRITKGDLYPVGSMVNRLGRAQIVGIVDEGLPKIPRVAFGAGWRCVIYVMDEVQRKLKNAPFFYLTPEEEPADVSP